MKKLLPEISDKARWRKNVLLYSGLIAIIVAIDWLTKFLTVTYLKPIGDFPLIEGVLHLTYAENTGAAFGMLKDHRWVFLATSTVAIIGIYLYLLWVGEQLRPLLGISLAFIVGGGIGNMIDRIALGYVVDFINFELIDFAIFNGADSFICVGAALMVIYVLFFEMKESSDHAK